jgi:hypothetical protein
VVSPRCLSLSCQINVPDLAKSCGATKQDWEFTFGRFSPIAARLEHHLRSTRAAAKVLKVRRATRPWTADLAKVQADPGQQLDPNKDAQTGLAYAVMAILKLVPTAFN